MDNSWIMDVEDRVANLLAVKLPILLNAKYGSKYDDLYVTTNSAENREPTFPNVYLHEESGVETNDDLEGIEVNEMIFGYTVEVITNTTQSDLDEVAREVLNVVRAIKSCNIDQKPIHMNISDDKLRSVMRFSLRLCGTDTI